MEWVRARIPRGWLYQSLHHVSRGSAEHRYSGLFRSYQTISDVSLICNVFFTAFYVNNYSKLFISKGNVPLSTPSTSVLNSAPLTLSNLLTTPGYILIAYAVTDAICSFSFGWILKRVGRIPIFTIGNSFKKQLLF